MRPNKLQPHPGPRPHPSRRSVVGIVLATLLAGSATARPVTPEPLSTDTVGNAAPLAADTVGDSGSLHSSLQGIDVTAERVTHAPGKSVYYPTRRQKDLSPDAMSLLDKLMIPDIARTPDGGHTAVNGAGLTYYINGAPAQAQDLEGIDTRDVTSVAYLDHPSDAAYLGAQYVVEFTVREYEYGGYTKLSQQFYFLGETHFAERLSSKFTYRRMTYDLFAGAQNFRYLCKATRSSETFRLTGRDVTVERIPLHSDMRAEVYPVQFRAVYRHGATRISNEVDFAVNGLPRESAGGTVRLTTAGTPAHPVQESYPYSVSDPYMERSASWLCNVSLGLRHGWSMSVNSCLSYTHHSGTYMYESGEPALIDRRVRENAVEERLDAVLGKMLTGRSRLSLNLKGNVLSSRSHYSGDSRHANDFLFPAVTGHVAYSLSLDKFAGTAYAGCAAEWNRLNGQTVRTVYPYGVVSLSYSPDRRLRCSLWMQCSTYSPTAELRNPTPVRVSGFLWKSGNPDLRPYPKYEAGPSVVWSPSSVLSLSASVNYTHLHDIMHADYRLHDHGEAVMQGYVNGGDTHVTRARAMASLSLLGGRLSMMGGPTLTCYRGKGVCMGDMNSLEVVGVADLYLGNFHAGCLLIAGGEAYSSFTMDAAVRRRPQYALSFGWGNSRWNLGAYLNNIFRTSWDNVTTRVESPVYSGSVTQLGIDLRQGVMVSAAYTFGYGRKIGRNDELDGGVGGARSAILK